MIIRVEDEQRANKCDELLTKLIRDEHQYDSTASLTFVVKDYFKNVIKDSNNVLLCFEEDNIIKGYVFFKPLTPNSKICFIDGLFVEEEYRKQGIASKLLEETLKMVKKDYNYVEINVVRGNEAAYNLYKKLGFDDLRVTLRKTL